MLPDSTPVIAPQIIHEAKVPTAFALLALLTKRFEHWATDLPSIELLANWIAVGSGLISFFWVLYQIIEHIKKKIRLRK